MSWDWRLNHFLEGPSCGSRRLCSLKTFLFKGKDRIEILSAVRESRPGGWVWKPDLVSGGKEAIMIGAVKTNSGGLRVVPKGMKANTYRVNVGKDILDSSLLRQTLKSSLSWSLHSFW